MKNETNNKTMNIREKLLAIQARLIAPKDKQGQGYKYRNVEDILAAAKPHMVEYHVAVLLRDSVESIADRFYIRAEATLMDCESNETIVTSALAREGEPPLSKSGNKLMSDGQYSGATSSYARKYALCALFAIDGSDKDLDDPSLHPSNTAQTKPAEAPRENETANDTQKATEAVPWPVRKAAEALGASDISPACDHCHGPLDPKDPKDLSKMIEFSHKEFKGRTLCKSCMKDVKNGKINVDDIPFPKDEVDNLPY